ncbi:MAG TPA: metallophosphoesterase family protein, partial [Proteobacteria bacterium]|nr:metallophosphoesterase family protein [Pseudomonadota bacterium]
ITVMWETESYPEGTVEYGLTDSYGLSASGTAALSHCGRYIHEIILGGLSAGAVYYYRVESGGLQSIGSTFRTAPVAPATFSVVAYGDSRSSSPGYFTHHSEVIRSILDDDLPDLVINVGDVVQTGDFCGETGVSGWGTEYFNPARTLLEQIPNYLAIGNHEYRNSGDPAIFQDYFSFPDNHTLDSGDQDLWYSFDYANAHFIMLNSNYYRVGGAFYPGSEQYEWLVDDLQGTDAVWKIIAFHHPPHVRSEGYSKEAREYLVPLFERYGVQAVLNGHFHWYERSRKRGINYIVTGGGGAPLYNPGEPETNPFSIYGDSLFHYCRMEFDDIRLSFSARDTDGNNFDSFQLDLDEDDDRDGYRNGDEYSSSWDPTDIYSPVPGSVVSGDYDGDGTDEVAVFRPSSGLWALAGLSRCYFGEDGDRPVAGDYRGDGSTEIGIFRPDTGLWALKGLTRFYFGSSGDQPVAADYNGDDMVDAAVFRPSVGLWMVRAITRFYMGSSEDRPVPADYDGDGTAEGAVFRMEDGRWAVRNWTISYFGADGDLPVISDYNGDGTDEMGIFRGKTGLWAIRGMTRSYFGSYIDRAIPGDYDGDGTAEPGIYRGKIGLWALRGVTRRYFGRKNDLPVTR